MKHAFEAKVVLITGSSMGIGKAMAYHFGRQGAKVVLNARNAQKLETSRQEMEEEGLEVFAIAADVSQWKEVEDMIVQCIDRYGKLDILINNAGIATRGAVHQMTPEVFEQVLKVNVLGSVFPTKAALPYLNLQKGSVIFISSIASFYGIPYNSIYSSSKKALSAFSQSLRIENKDKGLHVGIAYVGFTENDPKKVILDSDGNRIYLENRKGIKKQSPEQVAEAVANMILKKKKSLSLSLMGKALNIIHRIFPGIVAMIYTRNLNQIKAQSEGKPRYVEKK